MRSFSVKNIIGHVSDAAVAHAIHELEHHDLVDTLVLGDQDVQRHRLRAITEGGAECLIAHWRVRFDDSRLRVALDAPVRDYLDRLAPWIDGGRLRHDLD